MAVLMFSASSCGGQKNGSSEDAGDYSHIDIQLYPNDYEDAFAVKDLLTGLGYIVVVGGSSEPDPVELSMENPSPVHLVTEDYECIFFQDGDLSIEGRQINKQDVDSGNNVCVVGRDAAPTLFEGREDVLNMELELLGDRFRVIGVYEYEDESSALFTFVPITAAKKMGDVRIDYITVCLERGKDVRAEAKAIYDLLKEEGYDVSMNYYDCYDRPAGSIPRAD